MSAEGVYQHRKAVTFHVLEEERRTSRFHNPVRDLGNLQLAAHRGLDSAQFAPLLQEGDELGDGARTGAAADTVRAIDEWSDEVQAQIREDGLGNTLEEAAENVEDRVEQSGEVFADAYEKSRAEGQGPLDAASDGYNAVDRHHVPIDEKPQAE